MSPKVKRFQKQGKSDGEKSLGKILFPCNHLEGDRSKVGKRREARKGGKASPQFAVGLCDQGSQVGPALSRKLHTSDQATDTYGLAGTLIARMLR